MIGTIPQEDNASSNEVFSHTQATSSHGEYGSYERKCSKDEATEDAVIRVTVVYKLSSRPSEEHPLPNIPVALRFLQEDNNGEGEDADIGESQPSDEKGVTTFHVEQENFGYTYRFTATYDGETEIESKLYAKEETFTHADIHGAGNQDIKITFLFNDINVLYHLHMDYDRDGVLDEPWQQPPATWEWGATKRGAVIVNTCGVEALTKDYGAPLEIRRFCEQELSDWEAPSTWSARLEVSRPKGGAKYIRLWDCSSEETPQLVLHYGATAYDIKELNFQKLPLRMEALVYPGPQPGGEDFDGLIELTLSVFKEGKQAHVERTEIRVAPWMMPSHANGAEVVFVAKMKDNERFRTELGELVTQAGCELEVVAPKPKASEETWMADRWMQDCMELGFTGRPFPESESKVLDVPLRAPRKGHLEVDDTVATLPLYDYAEALQAKEPLQSNRVRSRKMAFYGIGTPSGSNYNSFGNLEVTPPLPNHPWGRIYYGPRNQDGQSEIDANLKTFLKAQRVQSPFEIDVSWLEVGHVDEILTIIPVKEGDFRVLIVSPKLAYDILDKYKEDEKATLLTQRVLTRQYNEGRGVHESVKQENLSCEVSVKDFLSKGLCFSKHKAGARDITAEALRQFNEGIQKKVDASIENELLPALGDEFRDKILPVPVLFIESETKPGYAGALTADMVNMLVLNKHCIIPKPFGPVVNDVDVFEKHVKELLEGFEYEARFLDDWTEYHMRSGEVHCGTNTLRETSCLSWWEKEPQA